MTRRPPRTRHPVNAELDALYAELPTIECRGLCHDSCGRISMTAPEQRRIAERGVDIPNSSYQDEPMVCPALTMLNRCGVYEARPMICRVWGLSEGLPCTYGCQPTRLLTDAETYEFLARACEIAGDHDQAAKYREPFATPESAARASKILRDLRRDDAIRFKARERRAKEDGTGIWVTGRGRISSTPPGTAGKAEQQ